MLQLTLRVPFAAPPIRSAFAPPCSRFQASALHKLVGSLACSLSAYSLVCKLHLLSGRFSACRHATLLPRPHVPHVVCPLSAMTFVGAFGQLTHGASRPLSGPRHGPAGGPLGSHEIFRTPKVTHKYSCSIPKYKSPLDKYKIICYIRICELALLPEMRVFQCKRTSA